MRLCTCYEVLKGALVQELAHQTKTILAKNISRKSHADVKGQLP